MGRWMESINDNGNVIDEIAPHSIIHCSRHLPKKIRYDFPIITGLDLHSEKWIDEVQYFKNDEISQLYSELIRIRRLSKMEEFISGLDNKKFLEYWKGNEMKESEFQVELDFLEKFILNAMEQQLEIKISL
ncbi:hypothetical protein [uncultured Psychroserpens sp.]|uniref:hypothetical protein n=1 Tax=uncultured Psychroserpens sp. TaxID=255436 RepID=UPI0026328C96|nr:hypothetical protein [uncultured Psychroserpens sp.]